jgi:hypothetical protein
VLAEGAEAAHVGEQNGYVLAHPAQFELGGVVGQALDHRRGHHALEDFVFAAQAAGLGQVVHHNRHAAGHLLGVL